MSVFSAIGKFNKTKRGYFSAEDAFCVTAEIERVFVKENRDGGQAFIAECKVLESNNDAIPAGSNHSIYENLNSKWPELALKKIHSFVLAALGGGNKVEEITEEVMEEICGEENPLAGAKVVIQGEPAVSKAGKNFCKKDFLPAE